jgi:Protein of unknown function (DUF1254)
VVAQPGAFVTGGLVRQLWSFAGDDDRADVNQTLIQPFVNYNLEDGWFLVTAPIITANWEADSEDRWVVPIGGGGGRVFRIGQQPVNAAPAGLLQRRTAGLRARVVAALRAHFPVPKMSPVSHERSALEHEGSDRDRRRTIPMKRIAMAVVAAALASPGGASAATEVSEQDIVDAYIYLLGRLLVVRQETLDLEQGFEWNKIIHRKPGGVAWADPNLDVAYSEAWIAVDETSCTLVEVPRIEGRYYTVQILNGWGETIDNINERSYPDHPWDEFAYCLEGAEVELPEGTQRIDLPGKKGRLLARVELGADPDEAVRLQKQIRLSPTGSPEVAPPVAIVMFTNEALPGVEAFDETEELLSSARDINPGMEPLQAKARSVAQAAADPAQREHIDKVDTSIYRVFRGGWCRTVGGR